MIKRAQIISTVLELIGIGAVVAGAALISWPLAAIVGGLSLSLIGYALGVDSEAN